MPARPLLALTTSSAAVRTAFLTVKDAADHLGLSPHTLYVWRHRRQGPPSFRMGPCGRVMYRPTPPSTRSSSGLRSVPPALPLPDTVSSVEGRRRRPHHKGVPPGQLHRRPMAEEAPEPEDR
ncbi:helix-turn-helix domain-containing protein [Streptomyces sp. NPDC057794]|uniref:helix-turn-helix domain-containing protein n=1 Tax=Streptomyces sp. NPDC057794 TaxID=3346251 RepID=UPI0036A0364D